MEHVNGWCFLGIYKGGLWENDLHVSAQALYIERIAAENKYLERENKQVIPSLQAGFTLLFFSPNSSTAVPISHSKLDLKACLQNKAVVRRLFGSILISYTSKLS